VITHDRPSPETGAVRREHKAIATRILAALSARDREVLMLFYLDGKAAEQIQAQMGVTATEFRLIKSRAKATFTARAQQPIRSRPVTRSSAAKLA
jgi:RNA polymerase sigma-70 factor (ECF subfamily)